jgi:hypothetical protein
MGHHLVDDISKTPPKKCRFHQVKSCESQQLRVTGAAVLLDDARLECHGLLKAHREPSPKRRRAEWEPATAVEVRTTLPYMHIYIYIHAYMCTSL